jgi:hypothetical protein
MSLTDLIGSFGIILSICYGEFSDERAFLKVTRSFDWASLRIFYRYFFMIRSFSLCSSNTELCLRTYFLGLTNDGESIDSMLSGDAKTEATLEERIEGIILFELFLVG